MMVWKCRCWCGSVGVMVWKCRCEGMRCRCGGGKGVCIKQKGSPSILQECVILITARMCHFNN